MTPEGALDLDVLINLSVSDAQVANGDRVAWVVENKQVMRGVIQVHKSKNPRWSQGEITFYLENAGSLSYDAIARHLGRKVAAIKDLLMHKDLPPATKMPGYLTGQKIADLLGLDPHKITRWIDEGMLRGERMPFDVRTIRRVSWIVLKIWLTRPENWVYFDARKIKNLALRSLILRAQERWGDEWWTSRQAADYLSCDPGDISRQIKLGRIHGVHAVYLGGRGLDRWSFWFVRKSEIEHLSIPLRSGPHPHWPPRVYEFIVSEREKGVPFEIIARKMKWKIKRVQYIYWRSRKAAGAG